MLFWCGVAVVVAACSGVLSWWAAALVLWLLADVFALTVCVRLKRQIASLRAENEQLRVS